MKFEDLLRKMDKDGRLANQINSIHSNNIKNQKEALKIVENFEDYDALVVAVMKKGEAQLISFGNPVDILALVQSNEEQFQERFDQFPDNFKALMAAAALTNLSSGDDDE